MLSEKSAIELEHEKFLEMKSQQHFFQLLLFQGFHPNVHWLAKKHSRQPENFLPPSKTLIF